MTTDDHYLRTKCRKIASMTDKRLNYEEIRRRAERRVRAQVGFMWHLAAYLCVNVFFWVQWFTVPNNPDRFPLLLTFGWGIGLFFHGVNAFFRSGLMDRLKNQAFEREVAMEKQRLRLIEHDESDVEIPKRKNRAARVRLTDDGELAEESDSAINYEDQQERS